MLGEWEESPSFRPVVESGLESTDDLSSSGDFEHGHNLANNESGLDASDDVDEESAVRSTNKSVFLALDGNDNCWGDKRLIGDILSPLTVAFFFSLVRE